MLCEVYSDEGYELPRVYVYMPSTQGELEEGNSGRVSSLWYVAGRVGGIELML